jgi:hypothetical protein
MGFSSFFSIPRVPPVVRRGESCSGIRALGIGLGADNAGFRELEFSLNRSRVARCSVQYPPLLFSGEDFLSGMDNGRDKLNRAHSRLRR